MDLGLTKRKKLEVRQPGELSALDNHPSNSI